MRVILWFLALAAVVSAHNTRFLVSIFRHGARREARGLQALRAYPDEFTGVGDLTPVGTRQMYLLGKAMREKYDQLFSEVRFPSQIAMPASYYNRTITSGASQLFGMFDFGSGGQLEADDPKYWMPPIPDFKADFPDGRAALPGRASLYPLDVHSNFESFVFLPDNEVVCKGLRAHRKEKFKLMIEKDTAHFQPLWTRLTASGYDPRNYSKEKKDKWDIVMGFEACDLIISRLWNDSEFKDVDDSLKNQCLYLHTYFNFRLLSDDYLPLVNQKINEAVLASLRKVQERRQGQLKAVLFSGHDTNFSMFILNFFPQNHLCVLERYKRKFDPQAASEGGAADDKFCVEIASYTANIVLDVYLEDDEYHVEFLVNNVRVPLDGSPKNPTLETFIRTLEAKTSDRWDEFCFVDRGGERLSRPLTFLTFVSFVALGVLAWLYFREAKRRQDRIENAPDYKEKLVL